MRHVDRPLPAGLPGREQPAGRPSDGAGRPRENQAVFRLEVLGCFSLTGAACAVDRLPKKSQGLLAYLAVHRDRAVPREQLATLLWGHTGPEQARRSLRQCLLSLRTMLGSAAGRFLLVDGSGVALAPVHVETDLEKFDVLSRSATAADLEAAQILYRGELLAGLQVASKPFASWLSVQRRRLATEMSDLLLRLAMAHLMAGCAGEATAVVQRLTVLDPLREDGHRLLMQLLAGAGKRNAALQKHAAFTELLWRELGVAPDPTTLKLAETIRAGDPVQRPEPAESNDRPPEIEGSPRHEDVEPATSTPRKASVAVLPFTNLSGDSGQNYFADGTAEDISIALGHVPWLFVIASSSALAYRDPRADTRKIGTELGVRYLLRGSVRKEDMRVRIVVQLIDTSHGGQVWAGRFDGELHDIFAMQDRVATQVAAIVAPTLRSLEIERVQRKRTESLTAYDLHLRALACFRSSLAGNQDALAHLARAIELDPSYGPAYGLSARCYHLQTVFGWALPSDDAVKRGLRLAHLGADIGKNDSETLWMAGHALAQVAGDYEYGVSLIDKSLALNPNSASAWISSCFVQAQLGDTEKALQHFARAQRLNPRDSMHHVQWHAAALAHFVAGRVDDAADATARALKERPTYPPPLRLMIAICGLKGRLDDGRAYVDRLLAVNPDATVARLDALWQPSVKRNAHAFEQYLEGLRLAGMPAGR